MKQKNIKITYKNIQKVRLEDLKICPEHTLIYGETTEEQIDEMITSMGKELFIDGEGSAIGQLEYIHITPDYFIISGVIRFLALKKLWNLGILESEYIDVIIVDPPTSPIPLLLICNLKCYGI